jgi:hypothetical protein
MEGRGRALVNVFVERLWRTVKYEEVYLRDYAVGWQGKNSLGNTSTFERTRGLTGPSAIARPRRSTRMADVTKAFALNFPLRRTRDERTPIETQPVNRLVAARNP